MTGSATPCDHCGTGRSVCWRKGPVLEPKLCNACGVRYLAKGELGLKGYMPGQKPHRKFRKHAAPRPTPESCDSEGLWYLPKAYAAELAWRSSTPRSDQATQTDDTSPVKQVAEEASTSWQMEQDDLVRPVSSSSATSASIPHAGNTRSSRRTLRRPCRAPS